MTEDNQQNRIQREWIGLLIIGVTLQIWAFAPHPPETAYILLMGVSLLASGILIARYLAKNIKSTES